MSTRRSGMPSVPPSGEVKRTKSGSLPPRADPAGTPRNRRVVREPAGPSLAERVGQALVVVQSGGASALRHARALATRILGPGSIFLRALGLCVGIGALFLAGRFVKHHLTTSPAFAIDAIDVKGLARVDRGELLQAAGLDLGMNVFAHSPDEVRARLLHHPWIVSAQVSRKLPSHFEIAVREREPVALLVVEACSATPLRGREEGADDPSCDDASSLYLVSDEAKTFKRVSGRDPVDLPVITGLTRDRLAADPEFQRRVLIDAVSLMHEYRSSGLWQRSPLGEIHLEANDGFSLYVGDDLTYVRLGLPPFTHKLRRMKKVFERLEREHARAAYIYLDNEQRPDRVAVRLR